LLRRETLRALLVAGRWALQHVVEVQPLWRASDANAPALALAAQGTVARCRLATFVVIGKDDDDAKIFRQIDGAPARRR
jgi:hypothetical protein